MKIVNRKYVGFLTWLCTLSYFTSYFARADFAAVITDFCNREAVSSSSAALIVTGTFISYGLGQLFSGYLGDKVNPKYLVLFGFVLTGFMNACMPLYANVGFMIVVWCINGFAHAMMWPPMVKILTEYLRADDYVKASVLVSSGGNAGTLAVYLLASLFIKISSWKLILFVASGLSFVAAVAWMLCINKIEKHAETQGKAIEEYIPEMPKQTASLKGTGWLMPIILIMITIVAQGFLRDGITTWMPKYLQQTYGVDTAGSVLATVLLPIFTIFTFQIASWLYRHWLHNEVQCAAAIFGFCLIATVLLMMFYNTNIVLSLALTMIINACVHGINLILVCMVAPHFQRYGKTSIMSGTLNFSTYVGSASATYGMALIFENFGWRVTISSWSLIAMVGTLCCVLGMGLWKKFLKLETRLR